MRSLKSIKEAIPTFQSLDKTIVIEIDLITIHLKSATDYLDFKSVFSRLDRVFQSGFVP